jgi:hypothetical protein
VERQEIRQTGCNELAHPVEYIPPRVSLKKKAYRQEKELPEATEMADATHITLPSRQDAPKNPMNLINP